MSRETETSTKVSLLNLVMQKTYRSRSLLEILLNLLMELKKIPVELTSQEFILFKNMVTEIKQFVTHYPKERTDS